MRKLVVPIVVIFVVLWVFSNVFSTHKNGFDFRYAATLPVLHNGRLKPIDSVSRHTLVGLHEKQALRIDGKQLDGIVWFFQMMSDQSKVNDYPLFRFLNPDKTMPQFLGLKTDQKAYSFNDIKPSFSVLFENYDRAQALPSKKRSPFQRDVVTLGDRIILYQKCQRSLFPPVNSYSTYVKNYQSDIPKNLELFSLYQKTPAISESDFHRLMVFNSQFKYHQWLNQNAIFYPLPISNSKLNDPHEWQSVGNGLLSFLNQSQPKNSGTILRGYAVMLDAFRANDPKAFLEASKSIYDSEYRYSPSLIRKMEFERIFNGIEPFYKSAVLYLGCFLLIFLSFIVRSDLFYKSGVALFGCGYFLHTFGILSRMFLQGRPPVTNLYSSAVFIGWVAILVALFLEKVFKNKMGLIVSCVVGFSTLIVAHYLSLSGDTLEMMQAVLDTNFWLSTHVVTVTMGYSGTFLAGFLSIIYIFRGVFLPRFSDADKKDLLKMIYGILCFALLFSFIGTVLGGIWADQSWGRFWGWDPKENGALLIVIWNAIILHAKMAGYIRDRGIAVCAVFGNIVTSFSWFGTNLLGVGLHSYGFTQNGFLFLLLFVLSQVMVMSLGLLPKKFWISEKMRV